MTRATKARVFTTAGLIHLTIATLLSLTFLFAEPVTVTGSALGFTPTPTESVTETVTPPPPPVCKLEITKTADPTDVFPGSQVTFVIEVCNVGNKTCEGVVVSDALPDELEVVSASASQGQAVIAGNGVRGEFGDLEPGTCATLTIVARVRGDVPPCTKFTNVATAGDVVSNIVTLTVPCLLPESGTNVPLIVAAGVAAMGFGLLATGLALKTGRQAV
jgi:uncharacterized repeat protein (TIGR01451 family)